jgi:signal transduction histidine kinase/Tfp pilus assembly protein PilF
MRSVALLILLFLPVLANAQPAIDSLRSALAAAREPAARIAILNRLSQEFVNVDRDSGKSYARRAIALAQRTKDRKQLAEAYRCFAANKDDDESLHYYVKALRLAKESRDKKTEGTICRNIAVFYIYRSNYTKGLEYSHRSLRINEELKDNEGIAGNLLNIGFIYNDLKNTDKALYYFRMALERNRSFDNPMMRAVIMENIGVIYNNTGKFHEAIPYLEKALKVYREKGNVNFMSTTLGTLGSCNLNLKRYSEAESYLTEALRISRQMNINRTMSANLNNLAAVYTERYDDPSAKEYYRNDELLRKALVLLQEAIAFDKRGGDLKALSENLLKISEIYEAQHKPDSALAAFKQHEVLSDSIFRTETKETVKNLEDRRAIELRDKQLQLSKISLGAKERQKWLLLSGLAFVLAAGALFFYQSRNLRKKNRTLNALNAELDQANKVKSRFFSILNHDLRSPVASLIHFLHLRKESPDLIPEDAKERLEVRAIDSAEQLLRSMEDLLLWSKGQMENFEPRPRTVAIRSIFDDTAAHFTSEEKVGLRFEDPAGLSVHTDEDYLKTIVRNLTGNAIKALENTENPSVCWKAYSDGGLCRIVISDNGPGGTQDQFRALYDPSEVVGISTGLGMHLIRDLAKAIGCLIAVETSPGAGTIVTLTLKK